MKRQLEVKAPVVDRTLAEERAAALGAVFRDAVWHLDTYFPVPQGRLKVREFVRGGELIYYEREDVPGPRESRYQVVAVADAAALRRTLTAALGVRATVAKERRLWTLGDARIHVDTVQGLGSFLEFEVPAEDPAAARETVAQLMAAFDLRPEDCVAGSYADLVAGGAGS